MIKIYHRNTFTRWSWLGVSRRSFPAAEIVRAGLLGLVCVHGLPVGRSSSR